MLSATKPILQIQNLFPAIETLEVSTQYKSMGFGIILDHSSKYFHLNFRNDMSTWLNDCFNII